MVWVANRGIATSITIRDIMHRSASFAVGAGHTLAIFNLLVRVAEGGVATRVAVDCGIVARQVAFASWASHTLFVGDLLVHAAGRARIASKRSIELPIGLASEKRH
jgi:hypothetical protein